MALKERTRPNLNTKLSRRKLYEILYEKLRMLGL